MKIAIDSSILVDALNKEGAHHGPCRDLVNAGGCISFSHILSETFSCLTGGKMGFRVPASQAAGVLKIQIVPLLQIISLTTTDLLKAYSESESRGIRGGAIYDYLHLFAARKAGAVEFHTLNYRDFQAFQRPGDPQIVNAAK